MNKYCANENEYHQRIINSMNRFPDELKSSPGLAAFIWAHEAGMHDAGRGGGNGSADLLTVDEEGMVWLIEAKFGSNPEHGPFAWEQLGRYRDAIANMTWQKILHYAEAFLKGKEGTSPCISTGRDTKSFEHVLENWQKRIGRSLLSPAALNQRMANSIKSADYGIMVIADTYLSEVVESGRTFRHKGPVAYIQAVPVDDVLEFKVRWLRPSAKKSSQTELHVNADSRFDAYQAELNINCSVDGFESSLCPAARDLWLNTLRPGLVGLGWDGSVGKKNEKSFGVDFRIGGRKVPLFSVGWTGSDSKAVARSNKLAGNASMRVDIQFNWMKRNSFFNEDFLNRWAARFYYHGWRGRVGSTATWGIRHIPLFEFRKTGGVMQYRPVDSHKGFHGGPGERESLRGFLQELSSLIEEITAKI